MIQPQRCVTLVAVLSAIALSGAAAEPDPVTPAVHKALKNLYPDGEVLKIDKERKAGVRRFEATIKDKAGEHTIILRSDGTIVESRDPVDATALPVGIATALKQKYSASKVVAALRVTKGNEIIYKLTLGNGEPKTIVLKVDGTEVPDSKTSE